MAMLRWLLSLFRRQPRRTRPTVGVCCHWVRDEELTKLRAMGVRHIRTSLYADGDGAQWLDNAIGAGLDVLCVTYRRPADLAQDRQRWPTVLWQVGNEPNASTTSPTIAAHDTAAGDIACGLAHGTPSPWIQDFCRAKRKGQLLALHIYGVPLRDAMAPTMAQAPEVAWLTEIGTLDAADLDTSLRLIDGARFPRVYVYDLYSPDDGYTLSDAHQSVIRNFINS